jgi:hypothetical protein
MDFWVHIIFWIAFFILLASLLGEMLPKSVTEPFTDLVTLGDSPFWMRFAPRRGDVGPETEQAGLFRDERYFGGYADVQRFGTKTDFCRMVQKGNDEKNKFFACALGGTENLSSTAYCTPSVKDGLVLGRDDYMHDANGDGREDYCRIVRLGPGVFRAECNPANDTGFGKKMVPDNSPPEEIQQLLKFYQGCVAWLRFRDDMVDYAENLYVNISGGAKVEEKPPRPDVTEGLVLNGENQYMRFGDDPYLNLGAVIQLRSVRAIHFWVRFEEFTNNAHIFDFGNGAGIDNVWAGILNRGNQGLEEEPKQLLCGTSITDVLPDRPSGAQPDYDVMSPEALMKTTDANVEEFTCEGFAVAPRKLQRAFPKSVKDPGPAKTADFCYEVWDKDQRKMRIVVPQFFKKGEWTHVVITAEGLNSFRPDIVVYKNGQKMFIQPDGWLPQNSLTEKNYLGKSNWTDVTSPYDNKDELFKGGLFDFRMYVTSLPEKTVMDSYLWGKRLLGL